MKLLRELTYTRSPSNNERESDSEIDLDYDDLDLSDLDLDSIDNDEDMIDDTPDDVDDDLDLSTLDDDSIDSPDSSIQGTDADTANQYDDADQQFDMLDADQQSASAPDGVEDPQTTPELDGTSELDDQLDGIEQQATENPDRQGVIRAVRGAHLVYKRESEDGGYEELWVYNSTNMRDESRIRKSILVGTDIPVGSLQSEDGSQRYEVWSSGNVEMLKITGLPN